MRLPRFSALSELSAASGFDPRNRSYGRLDAWRSRVGDRPHGDRPNWIGGLFIVSPLNSKGNNYGQEKFLSQLIELPPQISLHYLPDIVVGGEYCFLSIRIPTILKFFIVSLLTIPLWFLLSSLIRKIPYIKRLLG